MRCFTGDDTGLVKRLDIAGRGSSGSTTARWGEQAAGGGADRVCYAGSLGCVGAGLANGTVRFWRTDAGGGGGDTVANFDAHAQKGLGTAALHVVEGSAPRVMAVDKRGCVRVWRWPEQSNEAAAEAATPVMSDMGRDIIAASIDADGSRVVSGGRGCDPVVWDVNAAAATFTARNVPHDNLDLPVPVWISGVSFLPGQPQQFVASTGFVEQRLRGEVRLYDVAAKRRPVMRKLGAHQLPLHSNC